MSDIITWHIPHPGTLERLEIRSFEEGMDEWFEGFNLPRMSINGVVEDVMISHARVKAHYKTDIVELLTGKPSTTKPL